MTDIYHLNSLANGDDNITSISSRNINSLRIFGYCHNIRINKKMIFVVLRNGYDTIQLIIFKSNIDNLYDMCKNLHTEATIDVVGEITPANVKTCSVKKYELRVTSLNVINPSADLPFQIDHANDSEDVIDKNTNDVSSRCFVNRDLRLDNRWIDLRTNFNQNIFRLKSSLEACIRDVLIDNDFVEIHTPKLIPAVSEGGSNVFSVEYFKNKAYLAQSPQLYKQMMINSGFNKVFEFGPVFRAENSNTYRHLCEFTGLDIEFVIPSDCNHNDIVIIIWNILYNSFTKFDNHKNNHQMIEYILNKTNTKPLVFPKTPIIIDYKEACNLLISRGFVQDPLEDISTTNENMLGDIIKEIYHTDIFVLMNFPKSVRPFYTAGNDDPLYSASFDIILRGNEISSGAQRIHDPIKLKKSIIDKGIVLGDIDNPVSGLEHYLQSFCYGSLPHGGCGIGVERLIMLILGLPNIRNATLFPRDPQRIVP